MVTTLLALTLACKPMMPPPQHLMTVAPTTSRCEGADFVRRDVNGTEYSRQSFSGQCMTSRCEGSDLVQRDVRGFELSRQSFRCAPPPPVRLTQQSDAWRYGLTAK